MSHLPFELVGPFVNEPSSASPAVEGDRPALRLAATDVACADDTLRCRLHLSYGFGNLIVDAYERFDRALVLEVLDAAAPRGSSALIVDPTVNELTIPVSNFRGSEGDDVAFIRGWVSFGLNAKVTDPAAGVFVRVVLEKYRTETLHLKVV